MSEPQDLSITRVAGRHMTRVAGEVRFIKDRGGDHAEWGWNPPGSSERVIDPTYEFKVKNLEPVARTLRSALMALGHIQTARATFTRIKSQRISPDGNLGGRGYVMPIKDIRKQLSNCDEALSSITDCIYDELQAAHWKPEVVNPTDDPRTRPELKNILDDVEEIRDDPEEWAEGEESEADRNNNAPMGVKQAAWNPGVAQRRHDLAYWSERAECEDRDVQYNVKKFTQAGMLLFQQLVSELKKQGWQVKPQFRPTYHTDGGNYELVFNLEVNDDFWVVIVYGDPEEGEAEVGVQYDVDDIETTGVPVSCPPTTPRGFVLDLGRKNTPEFSADRAGMAKALAYLGNAFPKQIRRQADRVAARYLARRAG